MIEILYELNIVNGTPMCFSHGRVDHTAGNKAYFVQSDPLGNVTHLLDASSGELVSELDYLAFGQSVPLHQTPASAKNSFRFSSKFEDPGTGLVYYGIGG